MLEKNNFPKVTVILRGYTYESIRTVVQQMVGTKLRSVEITMNTENAVEIIKKISDEFKESINVGAGTVTTLQQAKDVIEAGARFILSPITLDKEILDYCKENNVISVPAAFSPSEIHNMLERGADIVKVFPAARLTPQYLKDIQAPLGCMPLMVVGGINAKNVQEYFDAGAMYAGIGSGIFNQEDIINCRKDQLKKSILEFEQQVSWEDEE